MLNVNFVEGRNNSILARIDGRVAFPERRGPQPQAGEVWEVKITGQNSRETVNFLRLERKVFGAGEWYEAHQYYLAMPEGAVYIGQERGTTNTIFKYACPKLSSKPEQYAKAQQIIDSIEGIVPDQVLYNERDSGVLEVCVSWALYEVEGLNYPFTSMPRSCIFRVLRDGRVWRKGIAGGWIDSSIITDGLSVQSERERAHKHAKESLEQETNNVRW